MLGCIYEVVHEAKENNSRREMRETRRITRMVKQPGGCPCTCVYLRNECSYECRRMCEWLFRSFV